MPGFPDREVQEDIFRECGVAFLYISDFVGRRLIFSADF